MPSDTISITSYFDGHNADHQPVDRSIRGLAKKSGPKCPKTVTRKPYRVVLYSHDTMGLGHIRRNLLLARILSESTLDVDVLLISGAREAGRFALPGNVDVVVLPALHKNIDGFYQARNFDIELDQLTNLRSQLITAAIKSFKPDLFVVDNVARGANGELDSALKYIRENGHTRCVLGLRDIQDEPSSVVREWRKYGYVQTIRDFYDTIWVYGDAALFDLRREYQLPSDISAKIQFSGYLDRRLALYEERRSNSPTDPAKKPFGLCLVGGGQDGTEVAKAFAMADLPGGFNAVLVTGPHMNPDVQTELQNIAARRADLTIHEYVSDPARLIDEAEFVVSMGGYNSVCELISHQKRALIVPRIEPRREQIIRAERLQSLGIIDMMHPSDLSVRALTEWIAKTSHMVPVNAHEVLNMKGTQQLEQFFSDELLVAEQSQEILPGCAVL